MIVKKIIEQVTGLLQEQGPEIERNIRQWIYDAEVKMIRQNDFQAITFIHSVTGGDTDQYILPATFYKLANNSPVRIDGTPVSSKNSNINRTTIFQILEYIDWDSDPVTVCSSLNTDSHTVQVPRRIIPYDAYNNLKEILELNGVTDVDSSNNFERLYSLYKSKTNGVITVENADASISFTLPQGEGIYPCKTIQFMNSENTVKDISSSSTIEIEYIKKIRKLEDDYEYDELLSRYPDIILFYCLFRGFSGQEDDKSALGNYNLFSTSLVEAIREDRKQKKISNQYTMKPKSVT